jgi:CHAT domain-containing protein
VLAAAFRILPVPEAIADWHRRQALDALLRRVALKGVIHAYLSSAPLAARNRGVRSEQVLLEVKAAAGALVDAWEGASGPAATHARGIADLAGGSIDSAVKELEQSAKDGAGDPAMWSDVAAARLEMATLNERPKELPSALVAADRALRLNPGYAPARFNRAAIIEALGFRHEAAKAWVAFLDLDHQSDWSNEALSRLSRLNAPDTRTLWISARDRLDQATDAEIAGITKSFPQLARTWAEVEILGRWGEALLGGDEGRASRQLTIARDVGKTLHRMSGEQLLEEAVARIDLATPAEARQLAQAHTSYRQGRLAMSHGELGVALAPLRRSASDFARLRSPMAQLSRGYEANTLSELQRNDDALTVLEGLRHDELGNEARHPALTAQTLWEIGLCNGLRGRWSVALPALTRSLAGFERLGERGFQGRVQSILSECYDVLGQSDEGWTQRTAATRLLADQGDARSVHVAAAAGTLAAMRNHDWEAASSLSVLDLATAPESKDPTLIPRAFERRAMVMLHLGNFPVALEALREGRAFTEQLPDRDSADRTNADFDVAEALILRESAPKRALELLDGAIVAYAKAGLDLYLPDLHLEHGRTLLHIGDQEGASSDFDTAIEALLAQRERIPSFELRTGIFDNAAGLFDEALRLALGQGNTEKAFSIVEASRARTLLDEITTRSATIFEPSSSREVSASLGNATFVELTVLPEKTVALVIDRSGLRWYEVPLPAAELEQRIDLLTDLITGQGALGQIHEASAKLLDPLLSGAELRSGMPLVISSDGAIQRIPWAALYNPVSHRYLLEDHEIQIAPSAAVFVANSRHATTLDAARPRDVLTIGNPAFDHEQFPRLPELPGGEAEAMSVRAHYAHGDTWLGRDATLPRFVQSAAQHDVIHFAGHVIASSSQGKDSFLLFAGDPASPDDGRLYAADITRMRFTTTRLVVLAACSSLRGPTRGREGMPSIARAFLASGVPAVVGTLWDVNDSVSQQMFTRLHRGLIAGLPPGQALREAQLDMLHCADPLLSHPANWSGVQVAGGSPSATRSQKMSVHRHPEPPKPRGRSVGWERWRTAKDLLRRAAVGACNDSSARELNWPSLLPQILRSRPPAPPRSPPRSG